MKFLGIVTCIMGSILASMFIACEFLGMNLGLYFNLHNTGLGLKHLPCIDSTLLLLEFLLINGLGFAFYYVGDKEECDKA